MGPHLKNLQGKLGGGGGAFVSGHLSSSEWRNGCFPKTTLPLHWGLGSRVSPAFHLHIPTTETSWRSIEFGFGNVYTVVKAFSNKKQLKNTYFRRRIWMCFLEHWLELRTVTKILLLGFISSTRSLVSWGWGLSGVYFIFLGYTTQPGT